MIAAVGFWTLTRPALQPLKRFVITPPAAAPLGNFFGNDLAISPDGRHIVYYSGRGGTRQLYVRAMKDLVSRPIGGTEGTNSSFFFSPDGESVAFFTPGKLKKVSLIGGAAIALCDATRGRGGSWAENTIVFAASSESGLGLHRVSAAGGESQILAIPDPDKGELQYLAPQILPGGKAVLFTIRGGGENFQTAVLSLETAEKKIVVRGSRAAHYAPSGHLVYEVALTESLMAVPFDPVRLEVTGDPAPVLEGVRHSDSGLVDYAFSGEGTLVYVPEEGAERRLVWVDREGKAEFLAAPLQPYDEPSLSPDGQKVAVQVRSNVWVYDIARTTLTPLNFEGNNKYPIWTPDGKRLTFSSDRAGGPRNLFWKPADGSSGEERLTTSENNQIPNSWSPDGEVLAFTEFHPTAGFDIWVLSLEGERKPQPWLQTEFLQSNAQFSPDGRSLAYQSDESGRWEVYVRPFPDPGGKLQVSTLGGFEPKWAPNGRELFYRNGNKMMVVGVTTTPTFTASNPRLLFEGNFIEGHETYDSAPDGQRFLVVRPSEQEITAAQIHVVLNWFEELKRLVPTDN